MKKLKIIWAIVANIFVLLMEFKVLSSAYGGFEFNVIALLIIIYTSAVASFTSIIRFLFGFVYTLDEEIQNIKRSLFKIENKNKTAFKGFDFESKIDKEKNILEENKIEFWINSTFNAIFFLIAALYLVFS